jgi:hypothetical protein
MAQNNFKGGPGGRLKAAAANFNKPTMQDSLDLYNNAMALENFYKKSKIGYKEQDPGASYRDKMLNNPFKEMNDANTRLNDQIKYHPAQDVIKNNAFVTLRNANIPKYRKEIDKNKFAQRELSYWTYNVDAPMALYDRRIKPTLFSFYSGSTSNGRPDEVEVFKYDPLQIKPVAMLTPQERKLRGLSVTPTISIKTKPKPVTIIEREKMGNIEPLAPRQASVPTFTPGEMIAPVMRPVSVPASPIVKEPVVTEETIVEKPVARKPPRAVMPSRAGGWSNQPLLMKLFPKLYER